MELTAGIRARSPRAELVRALGLVTTVAVAVGGGFAASRLSAGRDALVVTVIGALLVLPILIRIAQRRFDPFEPIVVFAIAFGAMFVLRPAAMLIEDDFVYARSSRTIPIRETFSEMAMLAAAGAAAFVGAYALPLGARIAARAKAPGRSFDSGRAVGGALAIAAAGIGLTALFLAGSGASLELILDGRSNRLTQAYRSSSAYLSHGPYLVAPSALILFAIGRAYARRGLMLLAGLLVLFLLLLTVPTGSRMLLLPFVGGLLVYHYVSRRTRPGAPALAALLLTSIFVSTLLLQARTSDPQDPGFRETAISTLQHPERMLEPLTGEADAEMAPAFAAALKVVPEDLGFTRGRSTVGDFFTRPIPREWWHEKPLSPRETVISRLWPTEYRRGNANPEFSTLLYFYLDFALFGVIAGMALYGVAARALFEYFRAYRDNLAVQLIFSLSVPFIAIGLRDSPVDTLVRGAFIFLPILLVFRFARREPRSPRAS
jgi:hypothetical protein